MTEHVGDRDKNLTRFYGLEGVAFYNGLCNLGKRVSELLSGVLKLIQQGGMRRGFWKLRPPCTALSLGGFL